MYFGCKNTNLLFIDNKIIIFIIFIAYKQQKSGFDKFCGLWTTKPRRNHTKNLSLA